MMSRATTAYRRVYVESAGPARVLDELYAALLRDLEDARRAIATRELGAKATALAHAQAVIATLRASLDAQAAPALVANLARLYVWMLERLARASAHLEVQPLDEVARIAAGLKTAFAAAGGGP